MYRLHTIRLSPEGEYGGGLYGINASKSLAMLGGNTALYARLLKTFAGNSLYSEFRESLKTGDHTLIREKAHALKGVAANLSLDEIFNLIKEIEQDAKNEVPLAEDDWRVGALAEAYDKTIESIRCVTETPELLGTVQQ